MEERLARVEEKQTAMTGHIADLTVALQANTALTMVIKERLDELSGAKKVMVWLFGAVASVGLIITSWIQAHRR